MTLLMFQEITKSPNWLDLDAQIKNSLIAGMVGGCIGGLLECSLILFLFRKHNNNLKSKTIKEVVEYSSEYPQEKELRNETTEVQSIDPEPANYCPECNANYPECFSACAKCGGDLIRTDILEESNKGTNILEEADEELINKANRKEESIDSDATSYCPKCKANYREGFSTCADCGVDLIRYDEMKKPSNPPM